MWHIETTLDDGTRMVYLAPSGNETVDRVVTLTASPPLAREQWLLIARQFENMNIVPQFPK